MDRKGQKIAVFVTLLLALCSCSPRIIERVVAQRDTIYQVKHDTIYERDSTFIREKGDTIYHYVEKVRWKASVDTIYRVRVDSVYVERAKEVKVSKPLSLWQRIKIGAFWWLSGAVLLLLLWTFRKSIFKIA